MYNSPYEKEVVLKLNVKAFAIACGLIWGAAALIFGLWASFYGPAASVVAFMGQFYIGYAEGFLGAIVGFIWGFADAGIGGLILAWLYNFLAEKFKT